jgi:uncharacterized protein (TIGR02996 family)
MSPNEAGFLQSITDKPTDETARLIYADWLEDRNDPRATFARLSAEFLRAASGLAAHRPRLEPSWLRLVDPLFGRVGVMCLPDVASLDQFQQSDGHVLVRSVAVAPGVTVTAGETVLEIEGEKAVLDLPAEHGGLVLSVLVQPDQELWSRTPLFTFLPFQFVRPAVPAAWQLPGSPPLVPREPMLGVISFLDSMGNLWDSREHTVDYLDRYRNAAEMVFGREETNDAFNQSYFGRGWPHPIPEYLFDFMRKRNMTDKQIIRELVDRHVEALRLLLARYGQPVEIRDPR